uniref:Uncharacterized protein n=1 Tax=Oryza glaberrima TaxID=4538 RepID=I1NM87_ORYGL
MAYHQSQIKSFATAKRRSCLVLAAGAAAPAGWCGSPHSSSSSPSVEVDATATGAASVVVEVEDGTRRSAGAGASVVVSTAAAAASELHRSWSATVSGVLPTNLLMTSVERCILAVLGVCGCVLTLAAWASADLLLAGKEEDADGCGRERRRQCWM